MNRQQKNLLIVLSGALAVVLVVILTISLMQGNKDRNVIPSTELLTVAATTVPAPTQAPVSESELERLALSEEGEGNDDPVDVYDPNSEPID